MLFVDPSMRFDLSQIGSPRLSRAAYAKMVARADYRAKHLPGAVFFDIDEIADRTGLGAHMLPSAEVFAEKVGRLGIDNQTRVVVYDTNRGGLGELGRISLPINEALRS